ncbi:AAA family ATPase [Kluyvera ascorbata]|uniref:AAA family ATPase n=1 Tax=Kluyvera ascorbata TaxID=51288 RepID=UPI00290DF2AC|nr:AAA family ATPase [Kluyvera ascorbata]MDU3914296.1 AAA family ATPase [Kluyvera ascorbata]
MKNIPVVSSLRVKNLFGKHDLDISFKQLTVIVGKNGIGKTTLLKIINGLITDSDHINYSKICDSIELTFSDENSICYGLLSDKMIESANAKLIDGYVSGMHQIPAKVEKVVDEFVLKNGVDRGSFIKSLFTEMVQADDFKNFVINSLYKEIDGNRRTIFVTDDSMISLKKDLLVRYISTVNISANASAKLDIGNSIEKNLLDLAIYDEIRILLIKKNKNAQLSFLKELNEFLQESGKKAKLDHGECAVYSDANNRFHLGELSSGERQLVYILATVANTVGQTALFLMDEPEVSLHLSWQEKIIDAMMRINPLMQIIAVTHSPGIIMNGHMDAYVEMKELLQGAENV